MDEPEAPKIFVTRWVDYSAKYGFGFLLSDGTTGILFNDSTRITTYGMLQNFEYASKVNTNKGRCVEEIRLFSFTNFPDTLRDKVKLFNKFSKYLG